MPTQGIGTCLVPQDSGVPCGTQIEEGEPIRTLVTPFGGAIVGHKKCVDAYDLRKNKELDETMVKRVDQAGPGGPVDMTQAKDALMHSLPLETRRDGTVDKPSLEDKLDIATAEASDLTGAGADHPVTDIPFGESPAKLWEVELPATSELTEHERQVIAAFRRGGSSAVLKMEEEQGSAQVTVGEDGVMIHKRTGAVALSWPEANRIQAQLRQACVDAGLTVQGI